MDSLNAQLKAGTLTPSDFLKQVVWKGHMTKRLLNFNVCDIEDEYQDDIGDDYNDQSSMSTATLSATSSVSSTESFSGAVTSTQIDVPPQTQKVLDPCKSCQINEKNLMLECGHLIGSECWGSWKSEHQKFKAQMMRKRTRSQRMSENDESAPCPFPTCEVWVTRTYTCLN